MSHIAPRDGKDRWEERDPVRKRQVNDAAFKLQGPGSPQTSTSAYASDQREVQINRRKFQKLFFRTNGLHVIPPHSTISVNVQPVTFPARFLPLDKLQKRNEFIIKEMEVNEDVSHIDISNCSSRKQILQHGTKLGFLQAKQQTTSSDTTSLLLPWPRKLTSVS